MQTTIFLCRHGETEFNKEKIFHGSTGTNINENGRKQARILGKELARRDINKIFSGPSERNLETAEIISKETGIDTVALNSLKERHLGILEGKKRSWFEKNYPEVYKDFLEKKRGAGC